MPVARDGRASSALDEIRARLRAEPFEPFSIVAADGHVFGVREPDAIALSPDSAGICVLEGGRIQSVEADDVVGVHPAEDVSALALSHASHRGYLAGFNKGNRIGGFWGFLLGFAVALALFAWLFFGLMAFKSGK